MSSVLEDALAFTLGNEGGFVNHPADPGGATNFGITQKNLAKFNIAHPELAFPDDVRGLTRDQAMTIYRINYWRSDGIADPCLAIKVFDIGVNCGPGTSIQLLQKAVNVLVNPPISEDGRLGPTTLGAVNAQSPVALMQALCQVQRDHYQSLVTSDSAKSVFLKGWLNRAARIPEVHHGV